MSLEGWTLSMLRDTPKSITPPAMLRASGERPRRWKSRLPVRAKKVRTKKAVVEAVRAVLALRLASSPWVMAKNAGTAPTGSTITKSVEKATSPNSQSSFIPPSTSPLRAEPS